MNRTVWFAAGASVGVYALTRARRAAEVFTPDGLADRLAGLSVGARLFRDQVLTGMAEKEGDVRDRLGLHLQVRRPALPGGPDAAVSGAPGRTTTIGEGDD